jgi:hypothetical protein
MEEENNNILNFEDALKVLDTVSETFNVNVWIPSKKKEYTFKEIDAKQQKNMLSTAMNSSIYNTNFVKNLYNILNSNFLDKKNSEDLNNFTVFDKFSIAVSLKDKISDETSITFDEKNNIVKKVSLKPIIEKFKTFETPDNEIIEVDNQNVKIKLEISVPTIQNELQYEEQLHKKEKKVDDIKDSDEIQRIVSEAFIGETTKYIKTIYINDNNLNFENVDFLKKIKLVEKLPSGILQKILAIVSKWKAEIDSVLTLSIVEDGKTYTKVLNIDSVLFLN